jgi:hypothetical protein
MATDKKNAPQKAELSDDEIDRLVYEAMCRAGKFVPQTPEEVAEVEAKLNESAVELPASLRDPLAILKAKRPSRSVLRQPPQVDVSAIENMSCAARNGGEISPEVEKVMDEDEQTADRESENDAK